MAPSPDPQLLPDTLPVDGIEEPTVGPEGSAAPGSSTEVTDALSAATPAATGFSVRLDNFNGPFDLLLSLVSKHRLDITDISLSRVTDEFISYLRALDTESLDEATEFLVVAATLLDLKVAGLLPQGDLVDAEDVALLEARDLLFARLLQYRAFKQVAGWFGARLDEESARTARSVRLEEKFRARTPELVWTLSLDDFATLALLALAPRDIPTVGLGHLHAPVVSIREQAAVLVALLQEAGALSFRELLAGAAHRGVVVARFLAVLELHRRAAVTVEQPEPLGELTVTWSAEHWADDALATLGADYGN